MAKPKRLNIHPEDRVVGVTPRQKRDLFAGCNEPGKPWYQRDDHVFIKAFCRICKNADCMRARGAVSPWQTRMAEQVDYLLNEPQFSELVSEEHRDLAQMAFDDISAKAMRLEVARVRQDWEIPEGPRDGVDRVAEPGTTDQFDDAVRALAKAQGRPEPELGRAEAQEQPAHFKADGSPEETPETEYEYETQYPSSDGKRTYHVALSHDGEWACECDGFKHRKKCKHLDTVCAWYDEQVVLAEAQEEQEARERAEREAAARRPPPPPTAPQGADPRVAAQRPMNTPMPATGVMVGGGAGPEEPMRKRPPPAPQQRDAWEIPKEKVIEPGATVTLKGGKK